MKRQHSLRTLLGVTQQDAAMLLGISRAQWSMFEIGKRDLPLPAQQLLAEVLTHLQSSENNSKRLQAQQLPRKQQHLECLLRENEYQQLRMERKMADTAKKLEAQTRLGQLAAFLTQRQSAKSQINGVHQLLISKAPQSIETPLSLLLVEQQNRHELLVLEKLLLESQLRKCHAALENTSDCK